MRALTVVISLFLVGGAGCIPVEKRDEFEQVPSSPFGTPPPAIRRAKINHPQAPTDIAWRVDAVGRKLLAEDTKTGTRPVFATIGLPQAEIFHADPGVVYITEGLVRQCKTEGELAAVLASEVGKIVAEREATAKRELRDPDQRPPAALPIGGHGSHDAADPLRVVELAKFERDRPKNRRPVARPDPQKIARALLETAGYAPVDFDTVQPLLQNAARNGDIERQLNGTPAPQGIWRP